MAGPVWVQGCPSGKIINGYDTAGADFARSPGEGCWEPRFGYTPADHTAGLARGDNMAAMKPRTGDGPLEAVSYTHLTLPTN